MRPICLFMFLSLASALGGCLWQEEPATTVAVAAGDRLKAGDELAVTVAGEAELSGAFSVKEDGTAKTYIALYIVEYDDGYNPELKVEKGQVVVRLDAVQTGEMKNGMVPVSAAEIAKRLDSAGQVVLSGILFDFNKSQLKPDSRAALDEIASFLKKDPARKVYLVGHTDNVGGLDFNMPLSKARADAVVADLTTSYGISPARLKGYGVGPLAPIASNDSEDGRAKNRRVELIPQ